MHKTGVAFGSVPASYLVEHDYASSTVNSSLESAASYAINADFGHCRVEGVASGVNSC